MNAYITHQGFAPIYNLTCGTMTVTINDCFNTVNMDGMKDERE